MYEESVLSYVETHTNIPLYFLKEYQDEFEKLKESSVEDLIVVILENSFHSPSYRKTDDKLLYETGSNKYRSSIDIWRHLISIKPEVTIFEVMRGLFKLQNFLKGQYCPDVRRRVFKLGEYCPDWHTLDNKGYNDEYRITFYDWENIGL